MSAYKGNHFIMEGNLIGQAGEKGSGWFFALGFVHRRTDATILGYASGKRLSYIMTENGKSHDQIFPGISCPFSGKGIETVQGVYPNVSLRMPFGILRTTDQRFEFGKVGKPADLLEEIQSRGEILAFQYEFFPFFENSLLRETFHGDCPAKTNRFRLDLQVQPRNELHASKNPKRILHEGRADVTQYSIPQILPASEGVLQLTIERIKSQGVEGKVSAGSGLFEG